MTREIEGLISGGDWEGAEARCKALLQIQPLVPKLHAYLGLCHYRKQAYPDAAKCFQTAFSLDGKYWEAGLKLAQCLDRMRQYEQALEVATSVSAVNPNDPTLLVLLNGLRRQVSPEDTDGWQMSAKVRHNVFMADEN